MKQTAVEWLEERYNDPLLKDNFISKEEFQKAKAMEKEQIMDAYLNDRPKAGIDKVLKLWDQAEQYYTSTFNS